MIGIAVAGFIVGLIFGFFASVMVLLMRQSRNETLIKAGKPPYKDAIRPPFALVSGAIGAGVTLLASLWIPPSFAALFAVVVPLLLLIVSALTIRRQASA